MKVFYFRPISFPTYPCCNAFCNLNRECLKFSSIKARTKNPYIYRHFSSQISKMLTNLSKNVGLISVFFSKYCRQFLKFQKHFVGRINQNSAKQVHPKNQFCRPTSYCTKQNKEIKILSARQTSEPAMFRTKRHKLTFLTLIQTFELSTNCIFEWLLISIENKLNLV